MTDKQLPDSLEDQQAHLTDTQKKKRISDLKPRSPEFTVVGIGASAGGVPALTSFFDALPPQPGMAFVVVTHLHPERESVMDELLQSHTEMPVTQVNTLVLVEMNHVYVIPPNRNILITDTYLETVQFTEPRGYRAPIDAFFRSLADAHRNAIAIIFSGGGSDGAVGIKAIKERGGLLMVQDPEEAEYDSMPLAAIATGLADVVLPVQKLAEKLVDYQHQPTHIPLDPEALTPPEQEVLNRILTQVFSHTGHDFSQYKRSTILRRIQRRMQLNGYATLDAYLSHLRQNPDEAHVLFNDLLIGVTNFFRDQESWQTLAEKVIPKLFEGKGPSDTVRVWTIGCATGEEAYSIAMLLLEHAATRDIRPQLQIFATDLDENALALGRAGLYPQAISNDVSQERLDHFFIKEGNHYQIRRKLRDIVLFADHSVLRDAPFSRLDLLICRNLLIYLERNLQRTAFEIFHYALKPEGYLFLGSSGSTEGTQGMFRVVDKTHRLYQTKPWRGEHPYIPSLPLAAGGGVFQRKEARRIGTRLPVSESSKDLLALYRESLEAHSPPSILVDEDSYILHLSEKAGRYLLPPRGPLSRDLLKLVRPELQGELRLALFQAFERNQAVVSAPVYVRFNDHAHRVLLSVRPHKSEDGGEKHQQLALVVFLEDETDETAAGRPGALEEGADPRIVQLEDEVRQLRERLQTNIEEYESSNEELKAANEELQSVNEEYRSATEELETSKEELQSINEELQTVNAELKNKVEETSRAYSDLENLMAATKIATLFLDQNLRIKWYTPGMETVFNIIKSDRGRPIEHLTNKLGYEKLSQDARQVLRDLSRIEREQRGPAGEWFLIRLCPYRMVDNRIDGVVITFMDVTQIKDTEIALRNREKELALAQQSARAGFWTLDPETEQAMVSEAWREIIGLPGEDEAQPFKGLLEQVHMDDRPKVAAFTQRGNAETPHEIEFRIHHPVLGGRWILARSQLMSAEGKYARQLYGFVVDITEHKQMENSLAAAVEYSEQIVGAVREGLLVLKQDLTVQFANRAFYKNFNAAPETTVGKKIYDLGNGEWDFPALRYFLENALSNDDSFNDYEMAHEFESIGPRNLLLNGRRLDDEQSILLAIDDITERRMARQTLEAREGELRKLTETLEEKVEERTKELEAANLKLQSTSQMFSALFQATPIPTALTQITDGVLLDANDEFMEYFGFQREEVIGQPPRSWAREEDRARLLARLQRDGFVRDMDLEIDHPSGQRRTVLVSIEIAPIQGENVLITTFIDITERVQAERQVHELASELTMAEQNVRHHLSQILHDDLQQRLYAIELQMNFLRDAVEKADQKKLALEYKRIKQELDEAIRITRHLSVDLSPPILHDEGLREALSWLAVQMKEQYDLDVEIRAAESFPIPDTDMRVLLFQSVRETLFNIVKHAGVLKAQVLLEKLDHTIRIRVVDPGKGFDTGVLKSEEKKQGLTAQLHRLNLFGGELKIDSTPGSGTQVTIIAPLQLPERKR